MKLDEAIRIALYGHERSHNTAIAKKDSDELLRLFDRWLRHNNFAEAADALESEHMP